MPESKSDLQARLARLDATTDEEIARQIAEDPDTAPELDDEWFANAEVWHGNRYLGRGRDFKNGRRVGRPKGSGTKEMVTLRLDYEILDHFRAGGPAWQTRLNDTLREVVRARRGQHGTNVTMPSGARRHAGRNELVNAVADEVDLSKTAASKAVEAVFNSISGALKGGGEVRLVGFGTFSVTNRAASEGRNPRTGEKIKIPASKQARFKPGRSLRESLN